MTSKTNMVREISELKKKNKELIKEFEKIIDDEIKNEKDAINRKAVRNWSILNELVFIKDKLNKLSLSSKR